MPKSPIPHKTSSRSTFEHPVALAVPSATTRPPAAAFSSSASCGDPRRGASAARTGARTSPPALSAFKRRDQGKGQTAKGVRNKVSHNVVQARIKKAEFRTYVWLGCPLLTFIYPGFSASGKVVLAGNSSLVGLGPASQDVVLVAAS